MDLIYLAHPVRPPPGSTETVESNLRDAEWWLTHLQRANPGVAIIAPWILELRLGIGDEAVPEDRVRGLARCREAAAACDAILLCGPRISSGSLGHPPVPRPRSGPRAPAAPPPPLLRLRRRHAGLAAALPLRRLPAVRRARRRRDPRGHRARGGEAVSRNRRPQGGWARNARLAQRIGREWSGVVAARDERNAGRRDVEGGDCAACGWITARSVCPMCGAAVLDEVAA